MPPNTADIIGNLERSHFYGSLELKYEDGRLVLIRKTETLKPMEQPSKNDYNRK